VRLAIESLDAGRANALLERFIAFSRADSR
jgi:hypothetical protein